MQPRTGLYFFSCIVGSDQTTGKSNEAACARVFLQVMANRRKSWGHLSVSVVGSRGSVQSKALALSVQGVGLISLNPHLGVTSGARGPGKILPAIGWLDSWSYAGAPNLPALVMIAHPKRK